ncbi:MAG: MBL fold metallo-hydrolase [Firmicutes bacterium]|nr:MBL fold metallo-hydrolase [Bacillota bacterium]
MEIKRIIGGILQANCYIISPSQRGDEKAAVKEKAPCFIIDPGYDPGKIIKYIKNKNLSPEGIILTHHHVDHSGYADRVRKELDCPIMIHREDADRFAEGADIFLEDGDVLTLCKDSKYCKDNGNGCGQGNGDSCAKGKERGTVKLTVLHTPGHTRGGICLMAARDRICFTGDTIFNVDLGRTDLDDGSYEEMVSSIMNVIDKWENDITIYPGHGDPATMKKVRKINLEFLEIVNGN